MEIQLMPDHVHGILFVTEHVPYHLGQVVNGFSPMWKPGGKQFDACARGQLLFVAPWPYHSERKTITRTQCLQLNELAKEIATMQPQQ